MAPPPSLKAASVEDVSWNQLPDDCVVHIGRHCCAGAFLALEQSCSGWKLALATAEQEIWRALALRRFPRLPDLLRLSAHPSCFRTVYRNQLAAERPPEQVTHENDAKLADFIFTVELRRVPVPVVVQVPLLSATSAPPVSATAVPAPEEEVLARWTGCFAAIDDDNDAVLADGSQPKLWANAATPFKWDPQLVPEEQPMSELEPLRFVVYVTHKLRSIQIYHSTFEHVYDDDSYGDDDDAATLTFHFDDLPRRVCIADFFDREGFNPGTAEKLHESQLRCECSVATGRIGLRFKKDEHATEMVTDELRVYLVPLPWPIG